MWSSEANQQPIPRQNRIPPDSNPQVSERKIRGRMSRYLGSLSNAQQRSRARR